jgi:hypothetical protein
VTETLDAGIDSLRCHEVYLSNLGGEMADPDTLLRSAAEAAGERVGVPLATTFEIVHI